MTKSLLLAAAFALVAPIGLGYAAQPIAFHVRTAGDLADLCAAPPNAPGTDAKLNYCDGFAQGAVDVQMKLAGEKKPFCFPPGTSRRATMVQFSEWVRALPAHRGMEVTDGLFQYLGGGFPASSRARGLGPLSPEAEPHGGVNHAIKQRLIARARVNVTLSCSNAQTPESQRSVPARRRPTVPAGTPS